MTKFMHDQKVLDAKKKYKSGQITLDEYEELVAQFDYELEKSEKYQDYKSGKITNYAYIQWKKQNDPSKQAGNGPVSASAGKGGTSTGAAAKGANTAALPPMTQDEMKQLKQHLADQYAAGEITWDELNDYGYEISQAYKSGKTLAEVQKIIPSGQKNTKNPGTQAADQAAAKIEKRIGAVYGQAKTEMEAELKKLQDDYGPKLSQKHQQLMNGEITKEQYDNWIRMQVLREETLRKKIEQCSAVMLHANQKAVAIVNGETMNVFAENANFQSYQITQDTGMNLSFAVYDEKTVERLIKDRPELLPRKVVNGKKDKAWNQTKIANSVTAAILKGESIPDLAKRIARDTASQNGSAMVRYARTAMTSAQNAGRMEGLHRAKDMGIKVKKRWLATLDSRTRDAHADLDGQTVDVDEPFMSALGPIMYPGDPSADPANVYNCRCTLVYEYEGYPADPTTDDRLMYEEWDDVWYTTEKDKNGKEYQKEHVKHHRESKTITNMDYTEWKAAKEGSELNNLNAAKIELAEAQKAVIKHKINESKVYKDLWKDDVTLADYPAKKGSIAAKRDYYTQEIEKYEQAIAEGKSWATQDKVDELIKKRKLLNEFDLKGELLEKRNAAKQLVQDIYNKIGLQKTAEAPEIMQAAKAAKPKQAAKKTQTVSTAGEKKTPFTPDAYTQERKDNALWAKTKAAADRAMRERTGEVWRNAPEKQKDAIFEYTQSYSKFNEPLRGIEYGTSRYLGVGNTDLDAGHKHNGERLNAMTDIIDKCSYDRDQWLQRGCRFNGMDKFFGVDMSLLKNGSQKELEAALLGTTPIEYGFMSMGSSKGGGFDGDILLNIYAPTGTKMMYVEPFSYYGHDKSGNLNEMNGRYWDGKSRQPSYGREIETIMQQGSQFRINKVERSGRSGTIYVDMEVINQDHQQRWKKK